MKSSFFYFLSNKLYPSPWIVIFFVFFSLTTVATSLSNLIGITGRLPVRGFLFLLLKQHADSIREQIYEHIDIKLVSEYIEAPVVILMGKTWVYYLWWNTQYHILRGTYSRIQRAKKNNLVTSYQSACVRAHTASCSVRGQCRRSSFMLFGLLLVNFPAQLIRKTSIRHLFISAQQCHTDSGLFVVEPSLRHNRCSAWQW